MGVKREYIILGLPVTVLGAVSLAEANVLVSKEVALNDPQERKITYIEITEVSSEEPAFSPSACFFQLPSLIW